MPVQEDRPPSGWKMCLPVLGILAACSVAIGLFMLSTRWIVKSGLDPRWTIATGIIYGLAIVAISITGAKAAQKAAQIKPSPATRRYNNRVMVAMILYVAGLMVAIGAFREFNPTGALAWALALAPSLPLVAVITAMALYLREETDEFLRVLMLYSVLIATCLLLAVSTVWGFLEMFKLVPHAPSWAAFPIWAVGLGVGRGFLAGRYR